MQLRRFVGDNTPAALNAVREALGDDAIILANRRIGDRVEIIATGQIDDDEIAAAPALEAGSPAAAGQPPVDPSPASAAASPSAMAAADDGIHVALSDAAVADSRSVQSAMPPEPAAARPPAAAHHPAFSDIDTLSRSIDADEAGEQPLSLAAQATTPAADPVAGERSEPAGQRPATTGSGPEWQPHTPDGFPTPESAAVGPETLQLLRDLLDEHLEAHTGLLERRFQQQDVKLWGDFDPVRSANLKRLLRLGLGAELAVGLINAVPDEIDAAAAMRRALSLLKTSLPTGSDTTLSAPGVTVLSGSSGAGKSTVLMKLAAEYIRRYDRQSLVMICADNRRIGAFESLQACARLLGVPAVQARSSEELADRLAALAHKSLILVDHTLASDSGSLLIPPLPPRPGEPRTLRRLLVLPATLQAATAESIVGHTGNAADHCVLTQLDRSARLGEIFNALIRHQLPVAWWSDNAHIQHPLQKADASVLVATAVAMGKRLPATRDDELLMGLVQPARQLTEERPRGRADAPPVTESDESASKIARVAATENNRLAVTDSQAGGAPVAGRQAPSTSRSEVMAEVIQAIGSRPGAGSRIRSGFSTGKGKARGLS